MARQKVAIFGSVDEARSFDPPVTDPAGARLACERLGGELAAAGWDLVVYSAKSMFVEADVVHGYVSSGKATAKSIHVDAPIGKGSFDEYRERPNLFDPKSDVSADWEVTFYRGRRRRTAAGRRSGPCDRVRARPGTAVSIALLVIVPVLPAAGGALIRTSLDVGRDWTRAGVLGGAAGLITGRCTWRLS